MRNCVWDYIKSECNPADPLSTGLLAKDLIHCDIWWNGPEWFCNNRPFTTVIKLNFSQNDFSIPEIRKSCQHFGFYNLIMRSDVHHEVLHLHTSKGYSVYGCSSSRSCDTRKCFSKY